MAGKTVKAPAKGEEATGAPARWSGMPSLIDLRHEIDDLFEGFFRGIPKAPFGRGFGRPWRGLSPDVDVTETDKALTITAELPGMGDDDIEVTLTDDVLTIKGEKKEETEKKEKDFYLSERRYGSFQRSFRLAEAVDAGKISADFDKGVLTIAMPKTAKASTKAKKISVKKK